MDDNHDRFADELLDAALARHGKAEPRVGLEGRILARLRAEPTRPAGVRWMWVAGLAAATIAATVVFYTHWSSNHPGSKADQIRVETLHANPLNPVEARRSTEVARTVRPRTGARIRHFKVVATAILQPPQFPSPAPPSQQEMLLLEYVRATPEKALQASFEAEKSAAKDLEIAPLEISFLRSDSSPQTEETR